ncbi:MAG: hypothetical protein ACI4JA_09860 [Oscillospiraceae bacterium]
MGEKNFIGYEYHEITVKRNMASVYIDGYENFGWQLEGSEYAIGSVDSVSLKFKRDRKIRNKTELTRLQRNFDACVKEIMALERSKVLKASAAAYTVGIIGTAFMAGSVFAVTSELILLCIILAIPAFAGWMIPYFLYRAIEKKKTAEVEPLIDQKYDEIYTVCEKANSLLDSAE